MTQLFSSSPLSECRNGFADASSAPQWGRPSRNPPRETLGFRRIWDGWDPGPGRLPARHPAPSWLAWAMDSRRHPFAWNWNLVRFPIPPRTGTWCFFKLPRELREPSERAERASEASEARAFCAFRLAVFKFGLTPEARRQRAPREKKIWISGPETARFQGRE